MVNLAKQLQNQRKMRKEKGEKEVDDCTLVTSESTFATQAEESGMYIEFAEKAEDQLKAGQESNDAQDDDTVSVLTATTMGSSKFHCSFRPSDSFDMGDEMESEELEALDLSAHDTYEMTKRARRGAGDADLEVAIQAAINAQHIMAQPALTRIQRPRKQATTTNLLRAGINTFTRNMETIAQQCRQEPMVPTPGSVKSFVQARADTFCRNVETLTLIAKGDCETSASWESEQHKDE